MSKNKKLYIIALLLLIATIICAVTGVLLDFHLVSKDGFRPLTKILHRYSGYIFIVLTIFHIIYNKSFLKRIPK